MTAPRAIGLASVLLLACGGEVSPGYGSDAAPAGDSSPELDAAPVDTGTTLDSTPVEAASPVCDLGMSCPSESACGLENCDSAEHGLYCDPYADGGPTCAPCLPPGSACIVNSQHWNSWCCTQSCGYDGGCH